jgi:hypothetical protein
LIFLVVAGVSAMFCSRSFHPIRCDFVAPFSERTVLGAAKVSFRSSHLWTRGDW